MAKKKTPAKRSVALVKARPRTAVKRVEVLPAEPGYTVAADGSLQLGALGLVELKLTEREEQILSEPVQPADVRWRASKKNGPKDIPYLPHPVYTRWFNRAFGRMGWNLVPIGKPTKTETNVVLLPYVLHVHGKPVAFAWGEQEYFDRKSDGSESRHQSYGDVIESTVASALRRCAKHLGIGLELWDREWTEQLQRPRGDNGQTRSNGGQQRTEPAHATHAQIDDFITQAQRQRLFMIAKNAGRTEFEIKNWLERRFRITTTKKITRRLYDDICRWVEAPGPLPVGQEG